MRSCIIFYRHAYDALLSYKCWVECKCFQNWTLSISNGIYQAAVELNSIIAMHINSLDDDFDVLHNSQYHHLSSSFPFQFTFRIESNLSAAAHGVSIRCHVLSSSVYEEKKLCWIEFANKSTWRGSAMHFLSAHLTTKSQICYRISSWWS